MSARTVEVSLGADDAFGPVEDALASLRSDRPVLVADEREPAWPSHVVLPAVSAEVSWVAWMVRYTSGLLCAALREDWADKLDLPPMVPHGGSSPAAYTVAVDAACGVTTGISAADRARTGRVLAAPESEPSDLTRPGHVLGLRVGAEGVHGYRGFAEAAVDLCTLAGLAPVGLVSAVVDSVEGADDTAALAQRYELPTVTLGELVRYRLFHGDGRRGRVERGTRRCVSTLYGQFDAIGYRDHVTGGDHLALVSPNPPGGHPLVAVHRECLTGDVLGGPDCDCRHRFDKALANTAAHGGAVIYLRHAPGILNAPTSSCSNEPTMAEAGAAAAILSDIRLTDIHVDGETTAMVDLMPRGIHVAGTGGGAVPSRCVY